MNDKDCTIHDCDRAGVCYAKANGMPEMCDRGDDQNDCVSRRQVLLVLEGMGEQVNANPSTPGTMALHKGMRMAIGTAMDRIKSMPSADESPTFMGEPAVLERK